VEGRIEDRSAEGMVVMGIQVRERPNGGFSPRAGTTQRGRSRPEDCFGRYTSLRTTGFSMFPQLSLPLIRSAISSVSVLSGRRLGAFEVHERIGVGGMGEVYRARDTKLGRDVAIKTLPPLFMSDPERLARFEREARVLASLNHPHIGTIYGLEDADGIRALVLELVEGETLADRIARGPLALRAALDLRESTVTRIRRAFQQRRIIRPLQ
jgi:serine/threonine protein kinase